MTGLDFLDKNKKQKKTKHTDREETLVIDFRKMSWPFFLFSVFSWFVAGFFFYFLAIFIFSRRAALVEYGVSPFSDLWSLTLEKSLSRGRYGKVSF